MDRPVRAGSVLRDGHRWGLRSHGPRQLYALRPEWSRPYAVAYEAAQEADAAGDAETVQALADAVRQDQHLFDIDAFREARRLVPPTNGTGPRKVAAKTPQPAGAEFAGALFEF